MRIYTFTASSSTDGVFDPARGPPLWEAGGTEHEPTRGPALPPIPAHEFDQRLTW